MENVDIARFIYLGLLLVVIGSYVIVRFRGRFGEAMQAAAIWGLIILGLVAGFGLWGDISRDLSRQSVFAEDGRVVIDRAPDGHYHLTMGVNGTPVEFLVDTGASDIVLSRQDAVRAGIDLEDLTFIGRAQTANGTVATAPVRLDTVKIGPWTDRGVSARVNGGEMNNSLLGMRYLERFASIQIGGDRMVLSR